MPGALLFVTSPVISVVVMLAVAVMLIVTIKQIFAGGQRDNGKQRQRDDSSYISSSSDPRAAVVRTASVQDVEEEDDSTPIDMMQSEPSVYTGEELEDGAAASVSIKSFNFRTFDADTGPPDRNCFYDELLLELYDANTGRVWLTSYYVATPAGLAKFLKDQNWQAMFAESHIVVPSYDRASLVDAVLRQLNSAWEVSQKSEAGDRSG
jgi:FlaG/FlaF family flagellin (archaellin)